MGFTITAGKARVAYCLRLSNLTGVETACQQVLTAWEDVESLHDAVLFRSLDGPGLVELAFWSDEEEAVRARLLTRAAQLADLLPEAQIVAHVLTITQVVAGPSHDGDALVLTVMSNDAHPVLIATFDPSTRGRTALLDYMRGAGERLTRELPGWIGAALFAAVDGDSVVELLQFETMTTLQAAAASRAVADHQRSLATFGSSAVNAYVATATFPA